MKFRITAVLALLLIPVPAGILLSRLTGRRAAQEPFAPRAHAVDDVPKVYRNDKEILTIYPKGTPMPKGDVGTRAYWVAELPAELPAGSHVLSGTFHILPTETNLEVEKYLLRVEAHTTDGKLIEARDHEVLEAHPGETYQRTLNQRFELVPGTYWISFVAAIPGTTEKNKFGSEGPQRVAHHNQRIIVR